MDSQEESFERPESESKGSVFKVIEFMAMDNIADVLEEDELNKIGARVVKECEEDNDTRSNWLKTNAEALELAKQIRKEKSFPWPNASNVKFPLISQAALNFNARAYPEVVQGDRIVKAKVVGVDTDQQKADRAERISSHMSWQLSEAIPNWEGDTDKLLLMLPIIGIMFREVDWDEINLRPQINLLMPDELIVNYFAKSLELSDCRRISKEFTRFKNQIIERERAGLWLEIEYSTTDDDDEVIEKSEQDFIQQSRYLDLDKDGYEEPYIVTVHKSSKKVVRIQALYDASTVKLNEKAAEVTKIEPIQKYAAYHFIPAFDGGFYSTGFGSYLYPMNKSIDTLINQLIDAGTMNNMQSGFLGKGMKTQNGTKTFQPGEWKHVETKGADLRNNVFALPAKDPSMTLYQLLIFLIDTGKQMSSITDIMSGVPQGQNTPVGTTLAMIEQGMKVIDAVYKRVYLGLKTEYKLLYRINNVYLHEKNYIAVLDDPEAQADDYSSEDFDIVPVGDTRISSQMMRTMKAQAARDVVMSTPGANVQAASRKLLESMDIPQGDVDELIPMGMDIPQLKQTVEFLQGQVQTFQEYLQSGKFEMEQAESLRKNAETEAKVNKDNEQAALYKEEAEAQRIENAMLESGVIELLKEAE